MILEQTSQIIPEVEEAIEEWLDKQGIKGQEVEIVKEDTPKMDDIPF